MTGTSVASATVRKWCSTPRLAGLVVVRRDQEQPVGADLLGLLGQLDRVGGGVGADPGDDLGPVADGVLDRGQDLRRPRPTLVVGDSPVVPDTTTPSWPWSTRWAAIRAVRSRSTEPSSWNAVAIAVRTRPKGAAGADVMPDRLYVRGHFLRHQSQVVEVTEVEDLQVDARWLPSAAYRPAGRRPPAGCRRGRSRAGPRRRGRSPSRAGPARPRRRRRRAVSALDQMRSSGSRPASSQACRDPLELEPGRRRGRRTAG